MKRPLFVFPLLMLAASVGQAGVLLDTGSGNDTTNRSGGSGPGQGVSVATTTSLVDFGLYFNMPNGGNAKFMIWDATNANLLLSSTVAEPATSSPALHFAGPLAFTMNAGQSYWFGIIADNAIDVRFIFPPVSLTQNGLTLIETGNSNYAGFATPSFAGNGLAEIALVLEGTQGASGVPEPGTEALLSLGLVAAALLRRRLAR